MFLLISPNIWLPFAAASPHCSETVMYALIVTHKSFLFTLVPNIVHPVLPIKYSLLTLPCLMWVHLHLPKLNNICLFSDHLTNLFRSPCKVSLSASVFTVLNTFVSSASLSTLLHKSSSKSFINIRSNIGPNTDPCGTPFKTSFQFDISPLLLLSRALCRIKLLPVTHVLVNTWMLAVQPVYKLSNTPDDLKWATNTHFQGITNNIYDFARLLLVFFLPVHHPSTHSSTHPYSLLPIQMTGGPTYSYVTLCLLSVNHAYIPLL